MIKLNTAIFNTIPCGVGLITIVLFTVKFRLTACLAANVIVKVAQS